jgi:hypothetical protein
MQFTTTAEDMHAAAAEMNDFYDSLREEAWESQEKEMSNE